MRAVDSQMTAVLIDDELDSLTALSHDLQRFCPEIKIMAKGQSGKEGIKIIHAHEPDIVFLGYRYALYQWL